jgi:hypothetical protein
LGTLVLQFRLRRKAYVLELLQATRLTIEGLFVLQGDRLPRVALNLELMHSSFDVCDVVDHGDGRHCSNMWLLEQPMVGVVVGVVVGDADASAEMRPS